MPDQELPDQTSPGSELTRRVVVTGTGILVVSAALAACSSSGNSAQLATPTADEPLGRTSDIPVGGGTVFASQKVVVTQPTPGTFKAFSAVASQERCKSPDGGLRSMRLMLGDGADSLWWCHFGVWAALGQLGRGFEQRAA